MKTATATRTKAPAITFGTLPGTSVDGGIFAGVMPAQEGRSAYGVVLFTAKPTKKLDWEAAMAWAKKASGELPTRRELSLLRATLPEQFERDWYWSGEQCTGDESYAWCQRFDNGYQTCDIKITKLRARAVRRISI
jgi:hypothetical protein